MSQQNQTCDSLLLELELDGNRQNFAMLVVMGDHHIGGTWKKKIK
jgi:hypothetical protein